MSYGSEEYDNIETICLKKKLSEGSAIKCFECNSVNNSACLEIHNPRMKAMIPVVDCTQAVPNAISKEFFCRKMIQTSKLIILF